MSTSTASINAQIINQWRIEQLQQRYAQCIDEEQYAQWPELFTEQCLYKVINRDNHRRDLPFGLIYCDSRGMLRDRIASMRNANVYEPHSYRHMLGRSMITEQRPDGTWVAQTSFVIMRTMHDGAVKLFCSGQYLDHIVEQDGQLLFSQRIAVCDAHRVDVLIVIPI